MPKVAKRDRGRPQLPPASIRVIGADISERDRDYIRRTLGEKLAKAAPSIERVSVRLADENGPRGGVDQVCRIKVVMTGLPSVVFEKRGASLEAAVDSALDGVERTVRRRLPRRRMTPLKRRKPG
jgi:ribosome-associated translation inhibitor RaiA